MHQYKKDVRNVKASSDGVWYLLFAVIRSTNKDKDNIMPRIAGLDLPEHKRIDIALTYIYGIGRHNVKKVLSSVKIDGGKRVKDLTEDELGKIQKMIDETVKVEGDLKGEIADNIKRLREIGSYRGIRHIRGLPSRGQRTRSNARTKRGKRKTVGALRKEIRAKLETGTKTESTEGK